MKFNLTANAELDILTEPEMRGILRDWMLEVRRGIKFVRGGGQTDVAGGVWSLGDPESGKRANMGPAQGFMWSVTHIAANGGGYKLGTDAFNVFAGESSSLTTIATGVARQVQFSPGVFVVNSGDLLTVTGVGTGTAGTDVGITIMAIEVPVQLAWQLL